MSDRKFRKAVIPLGRERHEVVGQIALYEKLSGLGNANSELDRRPKRKGGSGANVRRCKLT